jgi:hypothetical protein
MSEDIGTWLECQIDILEEYTKNPRVERVHITEQLVAMQRAYIAFLRSKPLVEVRRETPPTLTISERELMIIGFILGGGEITSKGTIQEKIRLKEKLAGREPDENLETTYALFKTTK